MATDAHESVYMTTASTILITGATKGIGFGLATRYRRTGARVIITGRSAERLDAIEADLPGVATFAGDLARPEDREHLASWVTSAFGSVDVLINNAGIQRRVPLARDDAPWGDRQYEIDLLLSGPVHLTTMLVGPMIATGRPARIVNVTSGGAYRPQPFAPLYSAAKAALHSYTTNLRHALRDTSVAVTELVPPAVATGLAGPGQAHGADTDEFCDAAFQGLERGDDVIGFGPTATTEFIERLCDEQQRFLHGAEGSPVETYGPE